MTTEPTWDELVARLAEARAEVAARKAALDAIRDQIDRLYSESLENAVALVGSARKMAEQLEYDLRRAAVQAFEAIGDKHPHPAVSVGEYLTLDYDEKEAIDYCRDHLPKALKLNKSAFEKVAKVSEPVFVTFEVQPRARIDRDLSAYVTEREE